MKAVKAVVRDGHVVLAEPIEEKGEIDAVVVLLDDPWEAIVEDSTARPALAAAVEDALARHEAGETTPVDPDKMP
ncbi:MAG: hypothetical protein R6V58_01015 [Planctomycetota bacterium]